MKGQVMDDWLTALLACVWAVLGFTGMYLALKWKYYFRTFGTFGWFAGGPLSPLAIVVYHKWRSRHQC